MLNFFLFLFCLALSSAAGYAVSKLIRARLLAREAVDYRLERMLSLGLPAALAVGGSYLIYKAFLFLIVLWTESLWFSDVGYSGRFWTVLTMQFALGALYAALFLLFMAANLLFCRVPSPEGAVINRSAAMRGGRLLALVIAGFFTLGVFQVTYNSRKAFLFLQFLNAAGFGVTDPVFGKDISFYVFTLPLLQSLAVDFTTLLVAATVGVCAMYAWCFSVIFGKAVRDFRTVFTAGNARTSFSPGGEGLSDLRMRAANHGCVLGILFALLIILNSALSIYELMYSTRGVVFGPGWTDVNVQILMYQIYIGSLVASIALFARAYLKHSLKATLKSAGIAAGSAVALYLLLVVAVPAVTQHYKVSPNEFQLERPYISDNIRFTRTAYGLTDDVITSIHFPVNQSPLSRDVLTKDAPTFENIRLWDWKVLQSNATQYQAFRLYYTFGDVDVLRYTIGGRLRQLMYSARELDVNRLAEQSKTWQNLHLVYTHGFGAVANPVSRFLSEGMPDYWIRDIPPVSAYPELAITQPRIYFGAYTNQHVYVNTQQEEFDYPKGDTNATYHYQGKAGIALDSFLKRVAFALRFDGLRLLTSREVTAQSRILYRRDIASRVKAIAPFLRLDHDYYQVVDRGGLYFIWDAYTWSDHFPYSEPYRSGRLNYIRNSVKVVINAYDGTVELYVFDPSDPLIRAWQKAFPGMFRPAEQMPPSLRRHVRYPEDLLKIQGEIFSVYHMSDPNVFYNREDVWEPSLESSHGQVEHAAPYYVVMTLPGGGKEEFVLIHPFSPLSTDRKNPRTNMVAWLGARCDAEHYGKLFLLKFPKDHLIYGPLQISIRANQDEIISKDLTLWNQQGSQVIFGNLLVIPLADFRIIYVQPLFLQASVGKMPEIKRVIVSFGEHLSYGSSFEEALSKLVSGYAPAVPAPAGTTPAARPEQRDTKALVAEAARRLEAYQKLTGQGKFVEAGKEMEEVQRILRSIVK